MKLTILTLLLCVFIFGGAASAQNSAKLFDPVVISNSDPNSVWRYHYAVPFQTVEVYLNCPLNGDAEAYLSGPNGGNVIVDNFMTVNGVNVCPWGWNCFSSVFSYPMGMIGQPMENAYNGVAPIDISDQLNGSGIYRFELMDFGWTMGSSEIYINTSCSLEATTQVCHRNFGPKGNRTLTIGESALAAHLAHGDTEGPCAERN